MELIYLEYKTRNFGVDKQLALQFKTLASVIEDTDIQEKDKIPIPNLSRNKTAPEFLELTLVSDAFELLSLLNESQFIPLEKVDFYSFFHYLPKTVEHRLISCVTSRLLDLIVMVDYLDNENLLRTLLLELSNRIKYLMNSTVRLLPEAIRALRLELGVEDESWGITVPILRSSFITEEYFHCRNIAITQRTPLYFLINDRPKATPFFTFNGCLIRKLTLDFLPVFEAIAFLGIKSEFGNCFSKDELRNNFLRVNRSNFNRKKVLKTETELKNLERYGIHNLYPEYFDVLYRNKNNLKLIALVKGINRRIRTSIMDDLEFINSFPSTDEEERKFVVRLIQGVVRE